MSLAVGMAYDLRGEYRAQGYTEEQVAEFDSEETIAALAEAIQALGHRVDRIGGARALAQRLVSGDRWDLVFNIAEGVEGRSREAQVPALLEAFGLGYTFSDPLVCALTLDKPMTKRLAHSAGLATPRFCVVESEEDLSGVDLPYPLFTKPVAEGTGKGIDGRSRVESPQELREVCRRLLARFAQPVLVEEYLPGREFTVGVLGCGRTARVLGTLEIRAAPGAPTADYSYEMKESCEQLVEYRPAEHGELRREVEHLALAAYRVLQLRDAGRVDIRVDREGKPALLEVNALPGLHPAHSDLPMIARQEGMSFLQLIAGILASAAARLGLHTGPSAPEGTDRG
jgi:D-alanine-D-alanine ligase